MRCVKSNCKFRRPNKNPMDYYSYYFKHYYYWLYCIYSSGPLVRKWVVRS